MSAPARNAIDDAMKKLSPAPETSFGEGLKAGRRSDSSCAVDHRIDQRAFGPKRDHEILGVGPARVSRSLMTARPGDEIVERNTGLALGWGQQRHALETGDVAGLRRDLAVGRHHHALGRARGRRSHRPGPAAGSRS